MRNKNMLFLAVSVSALIGATAWAEAPYGNGTMRDSARGQSQSQTQTRKDSLSNDSATHNKGVTASNQTNNKGDIDITAKIRREIIATKGMSVNAQNVKIVTINGQVSLKGVVNTPNEKELIGQIATRVAGDKNVANALQVK